MKRTLVITTMATLVTVFTGSVHAVKGPGHCTAAGIRFDGAAEKSVSLTAAKYCIKGPDAALAAKMGAKLEARLDKLALLHNKRLTMHNCGFASDPNNPTMPEEIPVVPAGTAETFLLGLDEVCNGVDDP